MDITKDKPFMEWLEIAHGTEYRKLMRLLDDYNTKFKYANVECDWANREWCCNEKYPKSMCEAPVKCKCPYFKPKEK